MAGIKNIIRVTNFFFEDESDIEPHKGEENPEIPPFTVDRILTRKREAPNSRNLNWRSILKEMRIMCLKVEDNNKGTLFDLNIIHHPVS